MGIDSDTFDAKVRATAFGWLARKTEQLGDVLPRALLAAGFTLDGMRVPLLGPEGIFKPRVLPEIPLSITTAPKGPYDDSFGTDNLLRYKYRGTDPQHPDNRGLRTALRRRIPLAYFHGIVPGKYLATWPVFIVGDDPAHLTFTAAVDDIAYARPAGLGMSAVRDAADDARREYVTVVTRRRLHQRLFRERVVEAYRRQCAICRLGHEELLDAAHIIPDTEPAGEPVVRNGLALCKLHHAAFDSDFVGIRPDYVMEVRPDLLREPDGPTLVYAIQKLHNTPILIPRQAALQPARDLLEVRYSRFRALAS